MDSLKQARSLAVQRLIEIASAASLATVVIYVAVVATSPATLQLASLSA